MDPVHTERLTLRDYRSDDDLPFYSDPDVCRYLLHEPWTREDAREAVERRCTRTNLSDGALNLVVEADGRVIGALSAWFVDDTDHTVELGWTFAADVSGQGYATEAAQALLRIVFAVSRVHRATAEMDARNLASAKLASRIGMRQEALFVKNFWSKGEWSDTPVYAILRDEWEQAHPHDAVPIGEFAFPGPLRETLIAAILDGRKTSTSSLRAEYDDDVPRVGQQQRVVDSDGRGVCTIELTDVTVCALSDVGIEHAHAEGEGYADVAAWRSGHEKFWRSPEMQESLSGSIIDDATLVVLERFRVVEGSR